MSAPWVWTTIAAARSPPTRGRRNRYRATTVSLCPRRRKRLHCRADHFRSSGRLCRAVIRRARLPRRQDGAVCVGDNAAEDRIALQVQRELLDGAVAQAREVPRCGCYPDSSVWVRCECAAHRDLRRRELFTHHEVADAHELWIPGAGRPNVPLDVLRDSDHQSERFVIASCNRRKRPSSARTTSHRPPPTNVRILEQRGNLVSWKTSARANGRDAAVGDSVERSCRWRDRAVPARQNP